MNKQKEQDLTRRETPTELGRGSSVGRYLIVGLVGRGGMGEVYAAYDPELDRKIALKLLRARETAGADASEGRARLLREAQAIARLSDPNVVVVYDVGTFEERVFLAMEFVDGNTLGYWLQAKTHTWREVVDTFAAAGRGLASAHRAGIVHRDFKPDNVMIGRDGKVRVMDFGLARTVESEGGGPAAPVTSTVGKRPTAERGLVAPPHVGPSSVDAGAPPAAAPTTAAVPPGGIWTEDDTATRDLSQDPAGMRPELSTPLFKSRLTVTGAMMGTPAYMAPEQFQGGTIDARTDQFSFCAALYEGLYGERPFEGKNLQELSANVSMGRTRAAPAKARVPGWLRKVLLRGLRVQRSDRHASMDVLLAALSRDPARSRRRWAAAGAVASLIGVLALGLVQSQREQRMRCLGADAKLAGIWELPSKKGLSPRKAAIRRAFLATGKRYAADSFTVVMNALDSYVTEWNDMHREACEATNMRGEQSAEVLDLRMACLNDRFSEVRSLAAVFSDANGDVVGKAVEAAQALRPVQQCADIVALRAVVRPPDDPAVRRAVADVRTRLADLKALANAGRYKQATEEIAALVSAARETNYQPVLAEALTLFARLQEMNGDASGAEGNYEEALWIAEACRHDEIAAEAAAQLIGVVGNGHDRLADGERWVKHARAVLTRMGPGHDVLAGWTANNIGILYAAQGRPERALRDFREALNLKMSALGEEHFDVAVTMSNIALTLAELGRVDEAIDHNARSLRILEKTIGAQNPLYAQALCNGADFANSNRSYKEAEDFAQRALVIWEREFDPENPLVASALTALGRSLVGQRQPAKAVPYLERALMIREKRDPAPIGLGETRFALALAMIENNGEGEAARELARKARDDFDGTPKGPEWQTEIDAWLSLHSHRVSHVSMR